MQNEKIDGIRAEMLLAPVFDARGTLTTLVGVLGAAIYLSHPGEDDPEKSDIVTALVQIQEQLAELAEGLDSAISGMKITKKEEARL